MKNLDSLNSLDENQKVQNNVSKEGEVQNFYGRTYNEAVPFTQANFEALQNILNKRNELLSTVKSHRLI
ncbi:MAG: hypothetical protein COW65_16075 [Cytophagales bacterium CG18_big_fil_WC_8_21_14_2_50_42_9]|nr:MAG: hypothetical protein COW65_16075 [Cytophagales bacterium CG18_big_fil_WC_8_21_14_2_50_42_9]